MFVIPLDNEQLFVYNGYRCSRNVVRDYMISHETLFVNRVYEFYFWRMK